MPLLASLVWLGRRRQRHQSEYGRQKNYSKFPCNLLSSHSLTMPVGFQGANCDPAPIIVILSAAERRKEPIQPLAVNKPIIYGRTTPLHHEKLSGCGTQESRCRTRHCSENHHSPSTPSMSSSASPPMQEFRAQKAIQHVWPIPFRRATTILRGWAHHGGQASFSVGIFSRNAPPRPAQPEASNPNTPASNHGLC